MNLQTISKSIHVLEKQIEDISLSMVEAEGDYYEELESQLKILEDHLEEFQFNKDTMEMSIAQIEYED